MLSRIEGQIHIMRRSPLFFISITPFIAFMASSFPLLWLQFPQGHDWIYELVRVAQYKSALINGQFPPYWGADLYSGYGSPIFLFYAPLYSFVSSLCSVVTGSIASGSSLAILFFSIMGIISMMLLVQEALGENNVKNMAASRIAAGFFILNPYLMSDKLLRNANAEYTALCIFPFAIYGLLLIRRKPYSGALVLSFGLAITILAHNLTALVVVLLTGVVAVVHYLPERRPQLWFTILGSMAVSLGLSAFFWLPAIYYKSLVHIDQMTTGRFDFHSNFPSLKSLFAGSFYSTGVLLPCLLLLLWTKWNRDCTSGKNLYYFTLVSTVFFAVLQTRLSIPVWEHVPFMSLFQFPWRMMGPLAVVASMAVGLSAACALTGKSNKEINRHELMILLLCILNAAPVLIASRNIPENVSSQLPYLLTGDTISLKGLQATVLDEYLPIIADAKTISSDPSETEPVVRSFPEIEAKVIRNTGTTIALDTIGATSTTLQFSKWFFPGWTCWVNGIESAVKMSNSGTLNVLIPRGTNNVVIQLSHPHMRRIGLWISFISLICSGIIASTGFLKNL